MSIETENKRIRLNVGGRIIETYSSTFQNGDNSMLDRMFNPDNIDMLKPMDSPFFFDRDPQIFEKFVMPYYRTGILPNIVDLNISRSERRIIRKELDFWCINLEENEALVFHDACEKSCQEIDMKNYPIITDFAEKLLNHICTDDVTADARSVSKFRLHLQYRPSVDELLSIFRDHKVISRPNPNILFYHKISRAQLIEVAKHQIRNLHPVLEYFYSKCFFVKYPDGEISGDDEIEIEILEITIKVIKNTEFGSIFCNERTQKLLKQILNSKGFECEWSIASITSKKDTDHSNYMMYLTNEAEDVMSNSTFPYYDDCIPFHAVSRRCIVHETSIDFSISSTLLTIKW